MQDEMGNVLDPGSKRGKPKRSRRAVGKPASRFDRRKAERVGSARSPQRLLSICVGRGTSPTMSAMSLGSAASGEVMLCDLGAAETDWSACDDQGAISSPVFSLCSMSSMDYTECPPSPAADSAVELSPTIAGESSFFGSDFSWALFQQFEVDSFEPLGSSLFERPIPVDCSSGAFFPFVQL